MPEWLRRPFKNGKLAKFDSNKDDALSPTEYRAFTEYRKAQSAKHGASE
jgi:hypothetical protein